MRWLGADAFVGVRTQAFLYDALRSAVTLRVVGQRSCAADAKGECVALRSFVDLRFRGSVLAPHLAAAAALWQPPAAKKGQGDCDFPLGPPWILLYPLKRRRSAEGMEAAEHCILVQGSAVVAKVGCGFAFCRCFAGFGRRSCAAYGCDSSPVAASGGQGGIGGLRVPPTPSLDSLLTPLYRRRSARGRRRQSAAF